MGQRDALRVQVQFSMVPIWVIDRCSSVAVHVYGYLMKRANRERRAWPKIPDLAREMNKSVRTVERAIAELRKLGAIQTTRRHARSGAVLGLEFVLIFVDPESSSLPATDGGKGAGNQSATDGGMADDLPATGDGTFPPQVTGLKREPDPSNQIQEPEERSSLPAEPEPGRVFAGSEFEATDPCESFRLAWNAAAVAPIRPCSTLTPKRRRLIRAALAAQPLGEWRELFARVNRSSFCLGEKGWTASFDWLIATPDAAVKVREGQYDDRFSESELRAAADQNFKAGGGRCVHEPPCKFREDCTERTALLLRRRRAS